MICKMIGLRNTTKIESEAAMKSMEIRKSRFQPENYLISSRSFVEFMNFFFSEREPF